MHRLFKRRCLSCSCLSPCPSIHCPSYPFPSCLSCPMFIGADVSGATRRRITVPVSTLSHRRTQVLVRLAICHGNHFQEITVNCWCVFHHRCHLNRLLEVCTCSNSVLCNVSLPGSNHVTKVASLPHLSSFPFGTGVVNTSQERCCAISTFALILFLEHSPCLKHQRRRTNETRENALPSHDVLNKARSFLLTNSLFASRPSCSIKSCLLCCNVQMCTHASQVRIRFELHPPTFRVCVSTVKIRDVNGVPCVPECHLLQLPCCKGMGSDSLQPLDHEFLPFHMSKR